MKKSLYIICLLFIVAILSVNEGIAMSLSKSSEVCVFSAMKGIITYEGKPVSGAKIVRKVMWNDDVGESEEKVTNNKGEFAFDSMNRALKQLLPSQFVATQEITVFYNDQEFLIWTMGKLDKSEYGELGGKPSNFRCELTDELTRVSVRAGLLGTSCKWDEIN